MPQHHTIRTFIAIPLEPHIQGKIKEVQDHFKKLDINVKWVEPHNVHLTLKFLGDIKVQVVEEISTSLGSVLKDTQAFQSALTHIGTFPDQRFPRVIWVGLKDEERKIAHIAMAIEESLGQMGFKKEKRPFQAHATIGRVRSPKNISSLIQEINNYPWTILDLVNIQTIVLYKSTLTSHGSIYDRLNEIKLL